MTINLDLELSPAALQILETEIRPTIPKYIGRNQTLRYELAFLFEEVVRLRERLKTVEETVDDIDDNWEGPHD